MTSLLVPWSGNEGGILGEEFAEVPIGIQCLSRGDPLSDVI